MDGDDSQSLSRYTLSSKNLASTSDPFVPLIILRGKNRTDVLALDDDLTYGAENEEPVVLDWNKFQPSLSDCLAYTSAAVAGVASEAYLQKIFQSFKGVANFIGRALIPPSVQMLAPVAHVPTRGRERAVPVRIGDGCYVDNLAMAACVSRLCAKFPRKRTFRLLLSTNERNSTPEYFEGVVKSSPFELPTIFEHSDQALTEMSRAGTDVACGTVLTYTATTVRNALWRIPAGVRVTISELLCPTSAYDVTVLPDHSRKVSSNRDLHSFISTMVRSMRNIDRSHFASIDGVCIPGGGMLTLTVGCIALSAITKTCTPHVVCGTSGGAWSIFAYADIGSPSLDSVESKLVAYVQTIQRNIQQKHATPTGSWWYHVAMRLAKAMALSNEDVVSLVYNFDLDWRHMVSTMFGGVKSWCTFRPHIEVVMTACVLTEGQVMSTERQQSILLSSHAAQSYDEDCDQQKNSITKVVTEGQLLYTMSTDSPRGSDVRRDPFWRDLPDFIPLGTVIVTWKLLRTLHFYVHDFRETTVPESAPADGITMLGQPKYQDALFFPWGVEGMLVKM
jgi:hypothetical protein